MLEDCLCNRVAEDQRQTKTTMAPTRDLGRQQRRIPAAADFASSFTAERAIADASFLKSGTSKGKAGSKQAKGAAKSALKGVSAVYFYDSIRKCKSAANYAASISRFTPTRRPRSGHRRPSAAPRPSPWPATPSTPARPFTMSLAWTSTRLSSTRSTPRAP